MVNVESKSRDSNVLFVLVSYLIHSRHFNFNLKIKKLKKNSLRTNLHLHQTINHSIIKSTSSWNRHLSLKNYSTIDSYTCEYNKTCTTSIRVTTLETLMNDTSLFFSYFDQIQSWSRFELEETWYCVCWLWMIN